MNSLFNINSNLTVLVVIIAIFAGIGLFIIGTTRIMRTTDIVRQRLQEYASDRESIPSSPKSIYRTTPRELPGSLFNRTIKPLFQRIITFFGKYTPANSIAKSEHDLRAAGNPFGMHAREYYGIRILVLFLGIGLAFYIFFLYGFSNSGLLPVLLILLITLYIPRLWLNSKIRQRKDELTLNLPDALDMLSVCVTAGLSFDQGLKKICEYWHTALSEEFKQVLQEMEMGVPRAEGLRNLRDRVNVDDLSSFIAILIQAEHIGMSIAVILQGQAKQMRILRQYRAEEKANTLPAKMMVPVGFFIFPALLAVILGPLIPSLLNIF
jgi:tight adherence protein C